MRMLRLACAWCLGLFFAACASSPPPDAKPPASPEAAKAHTAPAAQPARAPSASPLDHLDASAKGWVYVDLDRLRRAPIFATLVAMARSVAATMIDDADRRCGLTIVTAPKQAAFNIGEHSLALVASLNVPGDKALSCLRTLLEAPDAPLADGTPAIRVADNDLLALTRGDLLYVSDRATLQRMVSASPPTAAALKSHLTLSGDTIATGYGVFDDEQAADAGGSLYAGERGFGANMAVDFKTPGFAATNAKELAEKLKAVDYAGVLERAGLRSEPPQIAVEGSRVSVRFDVAADRKTLEAATGHLTDLAIYGVRQYIRNAKTAEARLQSAEIAKDLTAYVERRKSAHKPPRFPPSAAPVPAKVPAGDKFRSTTNDWSASWHDIGFSMDEPQYFRYSVVTSRDGKHVVVRAEGDLDGDGRTSLFELPLDIDTKGEIVKGEAKETPEP